MGLGLPVALQGRAHRRRLHAVRGRKRECELEVLRHEVEGKERLVIPRGRMLRRDALDGEARAQDARVSGRAGQEVVEDGGVDGLPLGAGQAAKLCNNLIAGATMVAPAIRLLQSFAAWPAPAGP